MRITQCDDQCLVSLDRQEASRLMDACAMVVLAADSVPDVKLPAEMAALLCDLFEGLKTSADQPKGSPSSVQGL